MLASMASKASVLFSHFLFISLSKKGWNNKHVYTLYPCSNRGTLHFYSSTFMYVMCFWLYWTKKVIKMRVTLANMFST